MLTIAAAQLACADTDTLPREDRDGTFAFVVENDSIANTDRNYTNGLRAAWLSGTQSANAFEQAIFGNFVSEDDGRRVRRGFAIGHSIFTPDDIEESAPLLDQHPYAGWLYGEYSMVTQKQDVVDRFALQLGIVGPSAGARWVQNEVHDAIGATPARGWDNQIADEAGVVFSYDRKLRALIATGDGGLGFDLTPSYGVAIGNVYSNARVGLMARFGDDLRNDFGPPRVRPSLAGAGYFSPRDRASWYVFAGAEGRGIAHNIFLDGSLFRDGDQRVDSERFVLDVQAGVVVQIRRAQLGLTLVHRSEEFEAQQEPQLFGALSLAVKFD